jgi:hypothetical protein
MKPGSLDRNHVRDSVSTRLKKWDMMKRAYRQVKQRVSDSSGAAKRRQESQVLEQPDLDRLGRDKMMSYIY